MYSDKLFTPFHIYLHHKGEVGYVLFRDLCMENPVNTAIFEWIIFPSLWKWYIYNTKIGEKI
jgi:hypothetical protein